MRTGESLTVAHDAGDAHDAARRWGSEADRTGVGLAVGQRGIYVLAKVDGLTDVDVRYGESGVSVGEREADTASEGKGF